jgi:hypothetical protein
MQRLFPLVLFVLFAAGAFAQGSAIVRGVVKDELGNPLIQANVTLVGEQRGVVTDASGRYALELPAGRSHTIRFSYTALLAQEVEVTLRDGEDRVLNIGLKLSTLTEVEIEGTRGQRESGLEKIDPRLSRFSPTPNSGVENLLTGQLGVAFRSELGSGYNVRGGNFDENLVYVNDIEIYRPFLARAGQQEGLSFPNPDMIERLQFSAGGFEPRFGDKMSSVLDIQYKRPKQFAGSAVAGLMGGSVTIESTMKKQRLRQITGFRYRDNGLVLRGLDTQGEYRPVYTDLQTYWTYDLSDKVELGFLGLYSSNRYGFVPQSRETEFGTFNQALKFTVFFEGQEVTRFETFFGALNLNVQVNRELLLKFTTSAVRTFESERFDVLAQYRLGELERDLGSDQFGEVVRDLGVGSFLRHARNDLDATVYTFTHRGFLQLPKSYLQWGADVRGEAINDQLREWTMVDSADFSIPRNPGENLELNNVLRSRLELNSIRTSGFLQNTWRWRSGEERWWSLVAGVRGQYWTYSGQTLVSPRARFTYRPGWKKITQEGDTLERDYSFWLASGLYYQAPFYREVRKLDGTLNPDIRAQRSIHLVLGMDRNLKFWDRPFKFTSEFYYKYMDDLIPYQLENIRIRYLGTNNAKGFATGLDMKLSGEFIDGVESWLGASVMTIQEDLTDDSFYKRFNAAGDLIVPGFTFDQVAVDSTRVEPGNIPRPTDQRVNFALFFQDEMPRWPTFKVNMTLTFGTGVPFGPPNGERYSDTLRTGLYRRVDIGFSKQFLQNRGQEAGVSKGRIKDLWLTFEVFNLLNINNTITNTWVTDVSGRNYAIPDFLTPRRFNLKLMAWF